MRHGAPLPISLPAALSGIVTHGAYRWEEFFRTGLAIVPRISADRSRCQPRTGITDVVNFPHRGKDMRGAYQFARIRTSWRMNHTHMHTGLTSRASAISREPDHTHMRTGLALVGSTDFRGTMPAMHGAYGRSGTKLSQSGLPPFLACPISDYPTRSCT